MFTENAALVREVLFWSPLVERPARKKAPSILAIGDSWFFYPMPGGSLINSLRETVAGGRHEIDAIGDNGASLNDLVYGKHRAQVDDALDRHGQRLRAVLISAGGNDLALGATLLSLLHPQCEDATAAHECFRAGSGPGTLQGLVSRLGHSYDKLLDRILEAVRWDTRIVLHDYDNALPTGRSVFPGMRAWFKPVFDRARVPPALRPACVTHILDHFTATLAQIVAQRAGRVVLVRSRGTLPISHWANELHPTPNGFRRLVHDAWKPVLREIGIA